MARRDYDDEEEDRDDDRPRERRRPKRKTGGVPVWAWVLIATVGVTFVGCSGVGLLAFGSKAMTPTPKQKVSALHQAWAGRSHYDWIREYGDGDRNDFIANGGGIYYYSRPLAISDKTGKPCGLMMRMDGLTVTYVVELELR